MMLCSLGAGLAAVGAWVDEGGTVSEGDCGICGWRAAISAKEGEALKREEVVVEGVEKQSRSLELGEWGGELRPVGPRGGERRATAMAWGCG
jgi:hypothetical protein